MAWTAPRTWVASEDVTAAIQNAHIRDNFNETAPGIASAAGRLIVTDAINSIAERIPTTDTVLGAEETTTSTSYTDLSTAGPAVTVTTGTAALVALYARMRNGTATRISYASIVVSGASTVAVSDNLSIAFLSTAADDLAHFGGVYLLDGLTAGSNTFTMKYKANAGTAKFAFRRLSVTPF